MPAVRHGTARTGHSSRDLLLPRVGFGAREEKKREGGEGERTPLWRLCSIPGTSPRRLCPWECRWRGGHGDPGAGAGWDRRGVLGCTVPMTGGAGEQEVGAERGRVGGRGPSAAAPRLYSVKINQRGSCGAAGGGPVSPSVPGRWTLPCPPISTAGEGRGWSGAAGGDRACPGRTGPLLPALPQAASQFPLLPAEIKLYCE